MEPTTVFITLIDTEAQLVRSRLEAAGFSPIVLNENSAINLGSFSKSSMIRVQVPEPEAADAGEFLKANDP